MRTKRYILKALEEGWNWEDFNNIDLVDYCTNELEIPQEYLKEARCDFEKLELAILPSTSYNNDDWFVNLLRVAV